jgi:E3 ubiquitin-protein ligase HUWE1
MINSVSSTRLEFSPLAKKLARSYMQSACLLLQVMVCPRQSSALTLVYYTPDDTSQSSIFLYETSLITDVATLLVPGRGVIDTVLSAAIYVFDACAHHRSKLSEVVAAIGANVNHGILISLFRDTVRRLTANEDVLYEVVDALMGLIAYVATSPPHSNQIIGAGIIPLLLDIPKTTVEKRVNVSRKSGIVLTHSMSHVPWVSSMQSFTAHHKD